MNGEPQNLIQAGNGEARYRSGVAEFADAFAASHQSAPAASLVDEQAPPIPNDRPPVWDLVIHDMEERDAVGRERYGTPLQPFNGRDALTDGYQEALDLVVYLRQELEERRAQPDRRAQVDALIRERDEARLQLMVALDGQKELAFKLKSATDDATRLWVERNELRGELDSEKAESERAAAQANRMVDRHVEEKIEFAGLREHLDDVARAAGFTSHPCDVSINQLTACVAALRKYRDADGPTLLAFRESVRIHFDLDDDAPAHHLMAAIRGQSDMVAAARRVLAGVATE